MLTVSEQRTHPRRHNWRPRQDSAISWMTSRELRALLSDKLEDTCTRGRTRSSKTTVQAAGMEESDAEKIATLEEALRSAQDELSEERAESRRAKEREFDLQQRLKAVEAELENSRLRAEIEMLRAVEKAREEERKCLQSWADDLRERFRIEKKVLEEKVASLEAGSSSEATRAPVGGSSPGTTDAGTLASGDTSSVTPVSTAVTPVSTAVTPVSTAVTPVSTAATSDSTAATSDSTAATSDSTATRTTISTVTSAPGLTVASAGATGTATTTSPSASRRLPEVQSPLRRWEVQR